MIYRRVGETKTKVEFKDGCGPRAPLAQFGIAADVIPTQDGL